MVPRRHDPSPSGAGGGKTPPTRKRSTAPSFDADAAMEVEKILGVARMLAEDDVTGAIAALEDLLHPRAWRVDVFVSLFVCL